MALIFSEDFESGTDGQATTYGATSFGGFNNPGGVTFTSDSAVGELAMRAKTSTTTATYARTSALVTGRIFYVRMYVKLVLTPAGGFTIARLLSNSTVRAELRVNSNGSLTRRSSSANIGSNSPALLSTTEWARVEWGVDNNTQQLRVFMGANLHGTTPTYDSGTTAWTFTTSANVLWFGSTLTGSGIEVLIDEIAVDNENWPAPPVVTPPSPWRIITPSGPVVAIARVRTGAGWSPAP